MRILIIGDSLSVDSYPSPGRYLAEDLRARGHTVKTNAKVGRSAYSFFTAESGAAQLAQLANWRPDLVLVILGTNDVGLNLSVDATYMARIRDAFKSASIIAVGPPALPKTPGGASQVAEMMNRVFPRFIDWRPMTADIDTTASGRSPDLVHFAPSGAEKAAQRLAAALRQAVKPVPVWAVVVGAAAVLGAAGVGAYMIAKR